MSSAGPGTPSRQRAFVVLRHRDFRLLWLGQFGSNVGSHMQSVALGWQLYLLTGDPVQLGLLGLVRFGPILLISLVGGLAADARDRRGLLLVTEGILAGISAFLAIATDAGFVSVGLIYGVAFVAAIANAFDEPALEALVPQLVPDDEVPHATTMSVLAHDVSAILGPAVAGVAIAQTGVSATYWFDAFSFGFVVVALLAMHARPAAPVLASAGLKAIREAVRFARKDSFLLTLMSLDFLATFFAGATVLLPIFASEILDVGPGGLGLLYAASSAGAVAGSFALAVLPPVRRAGAIVLISIGVYGIGFAVFGFTSVFIVSLVALAIAGAADAVSMSVRHSIRQVVTPNAMRGRMAALASIFAWGGWELGDLEAGVTAGIFGTQEAVVLGGLAVIAIAVVTAIFSPRIRLYRMSAAEAEEVEGDAEPGVAGVHSVPGIE